MQISEKELESFIFEDLTKNAGCSLEYKGLTTYHNFISSTVKCPPRIKWLRQLDLGPYGRLDIVGYYRFLGSIHVELMELKANPIKVDDFEQICRYAHALREYVKGMFKKPLYVDVHSYLIGKGFESGHYIHNHLKLSVVQYDYDLDGLNFEVHNGNWQRSDAKSFSIRKSLENAEAIH